MTLSLSAYLTQPARTERSDANPINSGLSEKPIRNGASQPPGVGMSTLDVVAWCAKCEGRVFMLTCHHAHGTGHEWALAAVCVGCRDVQWFGVCHACQCDDPECPDCTISAAELDW